MNDDKCHFFITNLAEESISAKIGNENINNSESEKLLGIVIY